ncbi:uncharacterized protein F4807DRAFT_457748 [Annulohypoxylon truncatum]|uniref:uncharacterized protein n=1 Tax=Annulohypoxylon truncatum TaxID=327061 RepID=UPI002007CEF3|nr:uncharacterized protein F4807DRAFT_457748 [Annulohypoxylon truncatum]KAI1212249.1 hypothetical protein F4807DRAFT_457748 [Annulohypoxylon truncatum]
MPVSSKRSQRTRRPRDVSPSPAPLEQSSPSRPAKRRRKVDTPSSSSLHIFAEHVPNIKVEEPQSEPIEDEGSSLTVDNSNPEGSSDDDRLITLVTQHLKSIHTQASRDHANAIHESKTEDIEAYAKISAQDWTYYIRSLSINIGRTSEPSHTRPSGQDDEDKDFVHIDLGPSKTFSRQTAIIYYDSDPGKWYLLPKGRNGLKVDNVALKKTDDPHALSSGEVIEIGGIEMMFVLPGSLAPLRIHPMYLEQAGIKQQQSSPVREAGRTALPTAPSADHSSSQSTARPSSRSQLYQQPIAPAPPDYRRPGTPPSAKSRPTAAQQKTPAQGSSGTVIMSQSDVDLSKDENKHIKPHFSYAQMITQAIMSTTEEKLNLAGIYQYITTNYAYYRHQPPSGWQNSIRHNLSLNKSFMKAPRSTDEPGKGMKWEIVPEAREEMIRVAYKGGRGGHRGSSAPSSPSQPSQLSYITHGPRDVSNREPTSARKRKASPIASPPPKSAMALSQVTVTPDRKYLPTGPASFQDGSPLPRRKPLSAADSLPQSPPTLSSSYLQDEGASFVTPAPHRVHPRLAPPSTAQRPSQHMPTSSPAPFWKYADITSTPLKSLQYDLSPSKPAALPESSSPPAAHDRSPIGSPTRSTRPTHSETQEKATVADDEEEEGGFDLTKGFQSIGSYHAPANWMMSRTNGGRT